jgi:hypothetical protein
LPWALPERPDLLHPRLAYKFFQDDLNRCIHVWRNWEDNILLAIDCLISRNTLL